MPREMYSSKVPAVSFCTVRDFAHFRKNWYNMEQRQNKQKQGKVDGIFFWLLSLTTIYIRVLQVTISVSISLVCTNAQFIGYGETKEISWRDAIILI